MKKLLIICLVVFLVLAVAAADLWVVLKLGWPYWVGGVIFLGILGIVAGVLFVRKYLLRRRERKFVHRVVQLDEAALASGPMRPRKEVEDLQEKWREAVDLLKKSQLRKRGNPLYALPWFLIIGESGSGKTTALKNARLDTPLRYPGQNAAVTTTRNCDWWFFDDAIVLDTAGRYAIPIDETPDREEWEEFLVLLAKYRKREPVNGVIVTVAADKLLAADREGLRRDGQNLRKRIDQIMRVVGARFPIYVLVTKMDKVYGFSETFLALPDAETDQAFGYLNNAPKMHWEEVLDLTFRHLADQLRSARFTFLHKLSTIGPGLVLFPNEFDTMRAGLSEFLRDVFVDNPYQERPFLRGVYFSSGLQEGKAQSKLLGLMEQGRENGNIRESRGLFLKDVFARVLPGDRSLYTRAYEFLRWQRWTRSLGFTSWVLIWLALCGLLTYSFATNYGTLSRFTGRFSKAPVLQHSIVVDLLMLEKFRLDLEDMDKANHRWFIPRFGLNAAFNAEKMGKDLYADLFRRGFERPFDKAFYTQLSKVDATTDPAVMAEYAGYIVARADTLQDYLKHGKVTDSSDYARTTADLMKSLYPTVVRSDAFYTVGNMYAAYLDWTADKAAAQRGVELLTSSLNSLLRRNGTLEWLVRDAVSVAPGVKLEDFWERSYVASSDSGMGIPGAYTKVGRAHIEAFIKDLHAVSPDNPMLKDNARTFWAWYETQYYEAWGRFARDFSKGAQVYTSAQDRQKMATIMTTDHNPYWKFLDRMAEELPYAKAGGKSAIPPSWVALVMEVSEMRKLLAQEAPKDHKPTVKEKMTAEVHKVESGFKKAEEKVAPMDQRQQEIVAKRPTAAKSFGEYKKNLADIAPVATSQETGFQMVSEVFAGQADFSKSKSPYNQAFLNLLNTRNVMKGDFGGDVDFVWALLAGPLQYLIQYGVDRAAAVLQAQWEGDVLGKLEGVAKENLTKTLFDKTDGLAVKFRDGPAKPFLVAGKWGYSPSKAYEKSVFETSVPFRSEFLKFLNAKHVTHVAERLPSYAVPLETVPVAVNGDAAVRPLGNVVTLQCADGDLVLYNYNYPDSRTFNWAPDKCGTTSVRILFPDNLVLYKSYQGASGFPNFLKDFENGTRTFKPEEFPDKKLPLAKTGVKWIKVSYKIQNGNAVINTLKKPAGVQVPSLITTYSPRT